MAVAPAAQVPLARIGHDIGRAQPGVSICTAAACTCGSQWVAGGRVSLAAWAMGHQPPCPGSDLAVHVGLTDGCRTECRTCLRLVDTVPCRGSEVLRAVAVHPAREPAL